MKGKKLASLIFACAIVTSIAIPTSAASPLEESEFAPAAIESSMDEYEPAPIAYTCPSCHVGSIVYKTRYSPARTTGGTGHCRTSSNNKVCGLKSQEISRTKTVSERCSQGCGYSNDGTTTVEYGLKCPTHGDKWN